MMGRYALCNNRYKVQINDNKTHRPSSKLGV